MPFRGHEESATVVTVGINPSIREFVSRRDGTPDARRFETLSSLGVARIDDVDSVMVERMQRRCRCYFEDDPYMQWFAPLEALVAVVTGASYFDGSAYHLDLVPWATRPLWSQVDRSARAHLLAAHHVEVAERLGNPRLELIYLNGVTVCHEVGRLIPLTSRTTSCGVNGFRRTFFRGRHGTTLVIGCSSNLQEERLKRADRDPFMHWVQSQCRQDFDDLRRPRTAP